MIINRQSFLLFLYPLLYSLMILVTMPVLTSIDSASYIFYAENSVSELLSRYESGYRYLLFNEPVWLILNILITSIFGGAHNTILFFSFFSSFTVSFYTKKFDLSGWERLFYVGILLCFPLLLSNFVTHLREGVALAFFLIGYYRGKTWLRNSLILVTPLIHIGFIIVIFGYYSSRFTAFFKVSIWLKVIFLLLLVIIFSLALYFSPYFVGDSIRQLNLDQNTESSGYGFLYWIAIFIFYIFSLNRYYLTQNNKNRTSLILFALYVLNFYTINYFSFYAASRVLQSGLFFIFASFSYLKHEYRIILLFPLLLFLIFDWSIRFSMDGLGF